MRTIDLNADLGELEDGSLDAAVMPFISSANIACGAHAGNSDTMRRMVRLAKEQGVAIGAHPGYPDLQHFGRRSIKFSIVDLCNMICDQVRLLKSIAEEEGAAVRHVKLHGALYNDLANDYERSLAVSRAIVEIDPELRFVVFSGSETARAAEDAGLVAVHEVFADRAYTREGNLVPRSQSGAVIHDESLSMAQVEMMVFRQKVPVGAGTVSDGPEVLLPIQADSVCVHGDNPSAVEFVSNLRAFFERQKIRLAPGGDLSFCCFRLGERSLLARLPSQISKSTHRKIRALQFALEGNVGIVELVPCYAELKVDFDPLLVSFKEIERKVELMDLRQVELPEPRLVEVPVCYDGEDLAVVAGHNGLSEEEVIRLHAEATYLIYMLGFSPGFAYMGGLDSRLATPRLDSPRLSVPGGSVGIAGGQTGIYPVESPGGWNIIGRTDSRLFEPGSETPFLFEPGDEVRFVPVEAFGVEGLKGERVGGGARGGIFSSAGDRQDACPTLKIVEPGMYTTVQDRGRFGFQRFGMPPGGAMDRAAFLRANLLLGNDPDDAVLECTGTMPVLEFMKSVRVSVVYADRSDVLEISGGERFVFDPIRCGYRAYIAFEGGIDVPTVMGSRSTYVPARIGGLEGRVLRAGDELGVGSANVRCSSAVDRLEACPTLRACPALRVVPGPEADWFDCGGLNTFLSEAFFVSSKSDRTGIRMEGEALSFRSDAQMVSSGISMGTIQVPPSGMPIIMMADHPTTGGYPRIGAVVEEDLPLLAQLRPGDKVRFSEHA